MHSAFALCDNHKPVKSMDHGKLISERINRCDLAYVSTHTSIIWAPWSQTQKRRLTGMAMTSILRSSCFRDDGIAIDNS